ncbi:MAG TPA: hypothetical protein ENJ09_01695 [Planctomycetes bacterium]|nr:hypothetical protein [Planctomycetota bacterium]
MSSQRRPRGSEEVAEELAAALLPIVRRFLSRSTREYSEIEERLASDPDALSDEALLERLESGREEEERMGWCLGVLGAASGCDLLLARRERRALAALLPVVLEALGGRRLEPPARELPEVRPDAGGGWEAPLLVAWIVLRIGVARRADLPIRWALFEHGREQSLYLSAGPGEAGRLAPWLEGAQGGPRELPFVPGARLLAEPDALVLVLPRGTLQPSDSDRSAVGTHP